MAPDGTRPRNHPSGQRLPGAQGRAHPGAVLRLALDDQYRCSRLFQHEYLNRHFLPVVEGGPASSPIVYTVGKRGAQALVEHLGYTEQELRVPKQATFAWRFMEHLLAINDVRVAVMLAARLQGWALEVWEDEFSFRADPDHAHLQDEQGRTHKKPSLTDGYFRWRCPRGAPTSPGSGPGHRVPGAGEVPGGGIPRPIPPAGRTTDRNKTAALRCGRDELGADGAT
jgi:hypothetical protein